MSNARNIDEAVSVIRAQTFTVERLYKYLTRGEKDFQFDLHATNQSSGATILHAACDQGNADVVRALLEMGMQTNQVTLQGNTPLTFALAANSLACVKLLVEHGARLDQVTKASCSRSFLDDACASIHTSEEIKRYLGDLSKPTVFNPESCADNFNAQCQFVAALEAGDLDKAKLIFKNHVIDVNQVGIFAAGYDRCLVPSIRAGKLDVVSFLVECGCIVVRYDSSTKSLPEIAREAEQESMAQYLESVQRNRFETFRKLANAKSHIEKLIQKIEAQIATLRVNGQSWFGIGNNSKAAALQSALARAKKNNEAGWSVEAFLNHKDGDEKSINEVLEKNRIGFFTPNSKIEIDKMVADMSQSANQPH